jgi:hypothetical protein
MMIEITGVQRFGPGAYAVTAQSGRFARTANVYDRELSVAIGSDPAAHELQDLVPAIVELALPRLTQAFKS